MVTKQEKEQESEITEKKQKFPFPWLSVTEKLSDTDPAGQSLVSCRAETADAGGWGQWLGPVAARHRCTLKSFKVCVNQRFSFP